MGAFWLYSIKKRERVVREAWGDVKDEVSPISIEPAKYAVHEWLMEHGHMSGGIYATRKKNRDPDYFWGRPNNYYILMMVLKPLVISYAASQGEKMDNAYWDNLQKESDLAKQGTSLSAIRETVAVNSGLSAAQSSTAGTQIGQKVSQEYLESQKEEDVADNKNVSGNEDKAGSLSMEKILLVVLAGVAVYLILKK